MKGKLFKPKESSPQNRIMEFFLHKPKPWAKEESKIYTWKSSIPSKWIDIKGEEFFTHISKSKEPRLSIDILLNYKKYMHEFSLSSQKAIPQKKATKSTDPVPPQTEPLIKTHKKRSSISFKSSNDRNFLLNRSSSPVILTINSRPVTKEARSSSADYEGGNKVEEFLKRFDKKPVIKEQLPANKGLLGNKLRSIRDKSRERRASYCEIFNVKKDSEKIIDLAVVKKMHSVFL